jgi:hypothetical protein
MSIKVSMEKAVGASEDMGALLKGPFTKSASNSFTRSSGSPIFSFILLCTIERHLLIRDLCGFFTQIYLKVGSTLRKISIFTLKLTRRSLKRERGHTHYIIKRERGLCGCGEKCHLFSIIVGHTFNIIINDFLARPEGL